MGLRPGGGPWSGSTAKNCSDMMSEEVRFICRRKGGEKVGMTPPPPPVQWTTVL